LDTTWATSSAVTVVFDLERCSFHSTPLLEVDSLLSLGIAQRAATSKAWCGWRLPLNPQPLHLVLHLPQLGEASSLEPRARPGLVDHVDRLSGRNDPQCTLRQPRAAPRPFGDEGLVVRLVAILDLAQDANVSSTLGGPTWIA